MTIRIIRPGGKVSPRGPRRIYRATCPDCECIWEFDLLLDTANGHCNCPHCRAPVYHRDPWVEWVGQRPPEPEPEAPS